MVNKTIKKIELKLKRNIVKFTLLLLTITRVSSVIAQDLVADNMLLFQRSYGGWPKHFQGKKIEYNKTYTEVEKATIADENNRNDATIDNEATTKEIRYLAKVYAKSKDSKYLVAIEKGVDYLLKSQYKNGGWPQYYPDMSSYRHYITYNDNAMVNVLNVLYDVMKGENGLEIVNTNYKSKADKAIQKGISCILKSQIIADGKLTIWCQQHDEKNLKPVGARKFELAGFSAAESVGIVRFLMKIENPSLEITNSIQAAVSFLNKLKIKGVKFVEVPAANTPKGKDRVLVADSNSVIWARYYDIKNNKPFFSGRDGIERYDVSEIEYERRNGYAWYGDWPESLLRNYYPKWIKKNNLKSVLE